MGVSVRRTLAAVTPEDAATAGRPQLWAYGRGYLLRLARRSRATLDRAVRDGLELADPVEALAWVLEQRGRPDLALELRAALTDDDT